LQTTGIIDLKWIEHSRGSSILSGGVQEGRYMMEGKIESCFSPLLIDLEERLF